VGGEAIPPRRGQCNKESSQRLLIDHKRWGEDDGEEIKKSCTEERNETEAAEYARLSGPMDHLPVCPPTQVW